MYKYVLIRIVHNSMKSVILPPWHLLNEIQTEVSEVRRCSDLSLVQKMEQEVRGRSRCIIFCRCPPCIEASSKQGFGVEDPARSFSVPVRALCLLRCFSVCSGGRWSEQEVRGRGSMQEDQGLHLKAHPTYRPCLFYPFEPNLHQI